MLVKTCVAQVSQVLAQVFWLPMTLLVNSQASVAFGRRLETAIQWILQCLVNGEPELLQLAENRESVIQLEAVLVWPVMPACPERRHQIATWSTHNGGEVAN